MPTEPSTPKKKMEHNKGKGKAKEEPEELIELEVRSHQLPGPAGSLYIRPLTTRPEEEYLSKSHQYANYGKHPNEVGALGF
jgi:hypothetical protein